MLALIMSTPNVAAPAITTNVPDTTVVANVSTVAVAPAAVTPVVAVAAPREFLPVVAVYNASTATEWSDAVYVTPTTRFSRINCSFHHVREDTKKYIYVQSPLIRGYNNQSIQVTVCGRTTTHRECRAQLLYVAACAGLLSIAVKNVESEGTMRFAVNIWLMD